MIPRYTRKEMGHVWSDANKYQKWLEVELAAADTLADAGIVPKDAAALLRSRAKADAQHINELESRVKHDVIAFTMAVGESVGDPERRPLAALRHDLQRRRGHRAGPPRPRRLAHHRTRPGPLRRSARSPRPRISAHPANRPHPRHPRRAHHLRPEDRQLVCRKSAQYRALPRSRRATWRSAKSPAPSATPRTSARKSKRKSARSSDFTLRPLPRR